VNSFILQQQLRTPTHPLSDANHGSQYHILNSSSVMPRCSCWRRTSARRYRIESGHVIHHGNNQDDDHGSLIGKTALVTGASRGIGAPATRARCRPGAQVLVAYGRGEGSRGCLCRDTKTVVERMP